MVYFTKNHKIFGPSKTAHINIVRVLIHALSKYEIVDE